MKLNKIILTALMAATSVAKAETQLPYLGPEGMDCAVNTPGEEFQNLDNGYFTSEDCSVIYVKPPLHGALQTHSTVYVSEMYMCSVIEDMNQSVARLTREAVKSNDHSKIAQALEDILEIKQGIKKLIGTQTGAYSTLSANLNWGSLVREYQKLNSEIPVRYLPVLTGIFSTETNVESQDEWAEELNTNAIKKITVHGIELNDEVTVEGELFPELIKNLKSGENSSHILMSESLGISLNLNLTGACALKNQSEQQESSSYIAGTYTYFYPIQTKASFRIVFDEVELEKQIYNIAVKNNATVTSNDFSDINLKAIRVEINDGAFPNDSAGENLKNEYSSMIRDMALSNILISMGAKLETSINNSRYTTAEVNSTKVCRKRFLRSKKCHVYRYTIQKVNVDWVKIRADINKIMGETNAGVNSYRTIYMLGTSAMVPYKKGNSHE